MLETAFESQEVRMTTAVAPQIAALPAPLARPLFLADWENATFLHYPMRPADLQREIPFELDLFNGNAYVSLVAFTQRRLRVRGAGPTGRLLAAPLANHPFLNVRTYVRHGDERGIYFLCEWIPNRLAALLGPPLYGLPYRLGRLRYRYDAVAGLARHQIVAGGKLEFDAILNSVEPLRLAAPESLDEFLLERYTAFTFLEDKCRCFRVWHPPWPQQRVDVRMSRTDLLEQTGLPLASMTPACAHYSPGVCHVGLSAPLRLPASSAAKHSAGSAPPPARRALAQSPWLMPTALALFCAVLATRLAGWQLMWVLALAIYFGCKWHTLWSERRLAQNHIWRSQGYLLAWPGMDARRFLDSTIKPNSPLFREWVHAAIRTLAGAVLLWGACRLLPRSAPLMTGWTGMLGLTLLLHFGLFNLLSLIWRRAGVDARPIMDRPLAATSLGELWGRRWNRAFHLLARRLVFRGLTRRLGTGAASLATFLVSGLIHDLVISVPARGGFGLPTTYFILQGVGVLIERSRLGRRMGLTRGVPGRLFTVAVALGPAYLLFHPPFVTRVILPFLQAVGAVTN